MVRGVIKDGSEVVFLSVGSMVETCSNVASKLYDKKNINAGLLIVDLLSL